MTDDKKTDVWCVTEDEQMVAIPAALIRHFPTIESMNKYCVEELAGLRSDEQFIEIPCTLNQVKSVIECVEADGAGERSYAQAREMIRCANWFGWERGVRILADEMVNYSDFANENDEHLVYLVGMSGSEKAAEAAYKHPLMDQYQTCTTKEDKAKHGHRNPTKPKMRDLIARRYYRVNEYGDTFFGSKLHSYDDLPAVTDGIVAFWYCLGQRHRDGNRPATYSVRTGLIKEYYTHGTWIAGQTGPYPNVVANPNGAKMSDSLYVALQKKREHEAAKHKAETEQH